MEVDERKIWVDATVCTQRPRRMSVTIRSLPGTCQLLGLVGLVWGIDGAGRVGGIQLEDQAIHVRWSPRR